MKIGLLLDLLSDWQPEIRNGMVYADIELRIMVDGSGMLVADSCRYPVDGPNDRRLLHTIMQGELMYCLFRNVEELHALLTNSKVPEWLSDDELGDYVEKITS